MIGASPHSPPQPLGAPGRKTASGGLRLVPPRHAWRTASQAVDASRKNWSGRPWSRRGAVLPQRQQQPKKTTCDLVAAQPGRVFVDFGSASFVAGIGISGSVGVFTNLSTGSSGFFYTGGGNLGFEAGAGLSGGLYASAADLRGINANINVSGGVSGSANFSKDGRFVGGSAGQSARLGASVSISNTTFFGCVLQGN